MALLVVLRFERLRPLPLPARGVASSSSGAGPGSKEPSVAGLLPRRRKGRKILYAVIEGNEVPFLFE